MEQQATQTVITTAEFRRGANECRAVAAVYGPEAARPNHIITDSQWRHLTSSEFRLGYLYQWREYVEPMTKIGSN